MGAITPIGDTLVDAWNRLVVPNGKNGETSLQEALQWQNLPQDQLARELEEADKLPCRVAAPVQCETLTHDPRTPRFVQMALRAGQEALEQAGLIQQQDNDQWKLTMQSHRIGACIGSGMSGVREIVQASRLVEERGLRRLSPHFVPKVLSNSAAGRLSMEYHLQGPNHSVSTACAAGTHALGDAMRCIQYGNADAMIAGGAESCIDPLSLAGFCRLKALSTRQEPGNVSRPFDKDRDGFVMGEGAAVLVLEEMEHAKSRKATILAELCGYGLTGDAHHITAPDPEGGGAERAMRMALEQVTQSTVPRIGYVNAHATSTPKGDEIEARCIDRVLGQGSPFWVSSTKGATGHMLGAAGAIEAAFTVLALQHQLVPSTCNLDNLEESPASFQHVMGVPKPVADLDYAMSNSFGFGGTNASIVLKRYTDE